MGKAPDVFPSPNQPYHHYIVSDCDTDPKDPELQGITHITYLTPEGADTHPVVNKTIDDLKRRPRLCKTLAEIITAANYQWALADNEGGRDA